MPVFFKRTFGLQKYRTPEQSGCVFKRGPHTTEANRARLGTATAPPEQQNGARRRLGLPKAAGAPHAHLREGRQRAARAPSHFGAGKRTYSHTHSPPPSPAVQRGRSGCDRAHASSPCSAALLSEEHRVVVFFFFLASYPDASLTQPRLRDAGTRLKTTEGGRRTRVRAERQRAERAAAVPRCARPGGIRRR